MATQQAKSQRMSFVRGTAFTLVGLGSLAGGFDQIGCGWNVFPQISFSIALETVPSILPVAWRLMELFLASYAGLLEGFLRVTASSWQLILTFAGMA